MRYLRVKEEKCAVNVRVLGKREGKEKEKKNGLKRSTKKKNRGQSVPDADSKMDERGEGNDRNHKVGDEQRRRGRALLGGILNVDGL